MSTAPLPRADITVIHVSLVTRQATKGVVSPRRRKHQCYDHFRRVLPAILRGLYPHRFGCQGSLGQDTGALARASPHWLSRVGGPTHQYTFSRSAEFFDHTPKTECEAQCKTCDAKDAEHHR